MSRGDETLRQHRRENAGKRLKLCSWCNQRLARHRAKDVHLPISTRSRRRAARGCGAAATAGTSSARLTDTSRRVRPRWGRSLRAGGAS